MEGSGEKKVLEIQGESDMNVNAFALNFGVCVWGGGEGGGSGEGQKFICQ